MSFIKVYEITCDECQHCLVHAYSIIQCNEEIKHSSWITYKKKNHFCSQECLDDFKKRKENGYL